MESSQCTIRTLDDRKSKPTVRGLLDIILDRRDIILVAAGSFGCLRSLYLHVAKRGQLQQLITCTISPAEYAIGKNYEEVGRCLQRALYGQNVSAVLIYMSCVECLSRSDYTRLLAQLNNPNRIPVVPIFRGPLSGHLSQNTAEILGNIPDTGLQASVECGLPVLAPDYDAVNSIAELWGTNRFLITGGGCASCMSPVWDKKGLAWCRMNDTAVSLGMEKQLIRMLPAYYSSDFRPTFLLGTAVPAFVALNIAFLAEELSTQKRWVTDAGTTGWIPGNIAADKFLVRMAREQYIPHTQDAPSDEKTVSLLGCSYLSTGLPVIFSEIKKSLEENGWQLKVWSPFEKRKARLHWVVSAQGLSAARLMEQKAGIPFVTGIPVGQAQLEHLILEITGKRKRASIRQIVESKGRKLVILGEPLLTESLFAFIRSRYPSISAVRAILASSPVEIQYYRSLGFQEGWHYISEMDDLKQLCVTADAVLADPILADLSGIENCFPIPYHMVSGTLFERQGEPVIGNRGERELVQFLDGLA